MRQFLGLLGHEFRWLRPWTFLWVLLVAFLVVDWTVLMRIDELNVWSEIFGGDHALIGGFAGLLFASIGTASIRRDELYGVGDYLKALPIHHGLELAAKLLAPLMVWGVIGLAYSVVASAVDAAASASDQHVSLAGAYLQSILIELVFGAYWLTWGLLLGQLGRLAWALVPLVVLGPQLLSSRFGWLRWFEAGPLYDHRFEGSWIAWPEETLLAMSVLGTVLFGLAVTFRWWRQVRVPPDFAQARPILRRLMSGFLILLWVGVFATIGTQLEISPSDEAVWGATASTVVSTRYYRFQVRDEDIAEATALSIEADEIYERVAEPFDVFLDRPIAVDVTRGLDYALGRCASGLLVLDSGAVNNRSLLAHETAHFLAERVSKGKLQHRFVSEGHAEYTGMAFSTEADVKRSQRRAAAYHHRFQIPSEAYFDDPLEREYDPNLVYPLGAEFARVVAERCGEGVFVRVFEALSAPDAPQGLQGTDRFREAFGRSGCDFEAGLNAFRTHLDALVKRELAWLQSLPRLVGFPRWSESGLEVDIRTSTGARVDRGYCRIRPRFTALDAAFHNISTDDGVCRFGETNPIGENAALQVALPTQKAGVLWERWTHLPGP